MIDLFIFGERGSEEKRERNIDVRDTPPTGDLAHNPGTCPDWGSHRQPFGSQVGAQSTEPQQPGPVTHSSVGGHLGYCPLVAIVNNASVSVGVRCSLFALLWGT